MRWACKKLSGRGGGGGGSGGSMGRAEALAEEVALAAGEAEAVGSGGRLCKLRMTMPAPRKIKMPEMASSVSMRPRPVSDSLGGSSEVSTGAAWCLDMAAFER